MKYTMAYIDNDDYSGIKISVSLSDDELVAELMRLTEYEDLYEGMGADLAFAYIEEAVAEGIYFSVTMTVVDDYSGRVLFEM